MSGISDFFNVFFGSAQSQTAAYAILAAIIAICITILLVRTDLTLGNRFLLILFVLLTLIPSIFLILFEITCMVTGGNNKERWWCWLFAWIVAVFIIIYCILVIVISLSSLFTYNNAMDKVELNEQQNMMTPQNSNDYARSVMETSKAIERFENKADGISALMDYEHKEDEEEKVEAFNSSTEVITKPELKKDDKKEVKMEVKKDEKKEEMPVKSVHSSLGDMSDNSPDAIEPFTSGGNGLNYSSF
jgi:hypothetical protein